jgi:predicted metal-dependent HD superfamily phosphohydrolase
MELISKAEVFVTEFFKAHFGDQYVYHNLQHTQEVVAAALEIAETQELSAEDHKILVLAAWFHDTGYVIDKVDHEQKSCQVAKDFLLDQQTSDIDIEALCQLILSTKIGTQPVGILQEILCDADLSHIGSANYWDKSARLRHELLLTDGKMMTEVEWVNFELDFMQKHTFNTEIATGLYEKRKQKHIRTLKIRKLSLNPETADLAEELMDVKSKKKKKIITKTDSNGVDILGEMDLGRGVETMYRTTYRTHINLSSIADNKANIMLSINAIIISIVVSILIPRFAVQKELIAPTVLLLVVCLSALVFAILSTRPKITEGKFTPGDIRDRKVNLLFFGNYHKMDIEVFHNGMMEMIKDSEFLYSSLTRDLYYLGVVLSKKYTYLRICYGIFMYGLISAVLFFGVSVLL